MKITILVKCVQLDPRPQGAGGNEEFFRGNRVLGIEVTIPSLAARCIANLDHHGEHDTAETPSACEQALTKSLGNTGVIMATVRPDADSVTAMAVLARQLEGLSVDEDLIRAVGAFDRLGPAAGRPEDRVIAIARKAMDFKILLCDRVIWVADLIGGEDKSAEVATLVASHDADIAAARQASQISTRSSKGVMIASVTSTHRNATLLGYEAGQVVVAFNPTMAVDPKSPSAGTYEKFTVCRYDSHVRCDLPSALKELQALEVGWGGRGDIFGSPQGVSSTLVTAQVLEVVARHCYE